MLYFDFQFCALFLSSKHSQYLANIVDTGVVLSVRYHYFKMCEIRDTGNCIADIAY